MEDEIEAPRSKRAVLLWLSASLAGVVLCLSLFAFIAWIQPDLKGNQRIELTTAIKVALQGSQKDRATRAAKKSDSSREKKSSDSQPKRRVAPKKIASTKSASSAKVDSRSNTTKLETPRSLSLGPIGVSGGGATLAIPMTVEDSSVLEQVKQHGEWMDRRKAMVNDFMAGRPRPGAAGSARSGRGATDINITMGGSTSDAYTPPPVYPEKAKNSGTTGFVDVNLLISITGTVLKHEITGSQPVGVFDQAVIDVLPQWRFPPALDETGRPIEYWQEYRYEFKLGSGGV